MERFDFLNNDGQIGLRKLKIGNGNAVTFDVRRNMLVVRKGRDK